MVAELVTKEPLTPVQLKQKATPHVPLPVPADEGTRAIEVVEAERAKLGIAACANLSQPTQATSKERVTMPAKRVTCEG